MLRVKAHETLVQCIHVYLDTVCSCMNTVLQVQRRDGEWIDANPIPNTVLINIADMMQRWTSDKLTAVVYTVIITNNNNVQKIFLHNRQVTKIFIYETHPHPRGRDPQSSNFFHICNHFAHTVVPRNLAKWWVLQVGFVHYPETRQLYGIMLST